mgnify:CR=1 FL=1
MGKFNEFRFEGLDARKISNKYMTMKRVSDDKNKIVVKVGDSHILKTKFGYALILNAEYVVFLKDWQVDQNYYGNEVLLNKEFFIPKKWGDFSLEFGYEEDNLNWEEWLNTAIAQSENEDNAVRWTL